MAISYSPKIVTNGLVLCLDAANIKSYPGTGTTWTDLTGNGFFTIQGGATYNSSGIKYIEFDGNQGSSSIDSNPNRTNFGTNSFTLSCFIYFTDLSSIDAPTYSRICEKAGFPNCYFLIQVSSTGFVNFQGNDNTPTTPNSFLTTSSSSIPLSTWCNITCVFNQTSRTAKIYINGIESSSNNLPGAFTNTMTSTAQFRLPSSFAEIGARYGTFLIYNRALTESEIQENFNAYRGRFGI